jgi:hypothetical protein
LSRRPICPSPRGLDYDAAGKRLVVACETGEVYAIDPAPSGTWTNLATLGSGLRDVVIADASAGQSGERRIYVSRFRTAELASLDAAGNVMSSARPQATSSFTPGEAVLAWRLIRMPAGPPAILHQFASMAPVLIGPSSDDDAGTPSSPAANDTSAASSGNGSYGSSGSQSNGCSVQTIVRSAISSDVLSVAAPDQLVLPVDGVWTGAKFMVIAAGNGHTAALPKVFALMPSSSGECGDFTATQTSGQPIAIAASRDGEVWVQSREPAQLENAITGVIIPLAPESREDTGHAVFHSNSGAGIACASCHAEGGEDGHVWTFTTEGKRRTPSLRGTIAGTAPYHWDGTMNDIGMLADTVMTARMAGPALSDGQKQALKAWLYAIPPPRAHLARQSIRGRARQDVVREPRHRLRVLSLGTAADELGHGRRRNGPRVPSPAARRRSNACTLHARRLCCHARGALRPVRRVQARQHRVAHRRADRRSRRVSRIVVRRLRSSTARTAPAME